VATTLVDEKHNTKILRNGYLITIFQERPPYKPFFIAIDNPRQMLRSILPGDSMDKGKGYDDMISCAVVVSVSASCSRCHNLT